VTTPIRPFRLALVLAGTAVLVSGCGWLTEPGHERWEPPVRAAQPGEPAPREACADRTATRQAFFGDLHVHTRYSMDARAWDMPRSPDDAYAFATGEAIDLPSGGPGDAARRVRIDRPLDFAAVTDHAEWMAETSLCTTPETEVYDSDDCRIYRGEKSSWISRLVGLEGAASRYVGIAGFLGRKAGICEGGAGRCREALLTAWEDTRAAAERWYDRSADCEFTTFHAWEYSYTPRRSKTHRNVILRNEVGPELPLSWIDTPEPSELWRRLEELCLDTGTACDLLAIPHNPNLSNGRVFGVWYRELPLERQREEARRRARLEPLVEMMQVKGESECRNGFSGVVGGPDELCDFEKMRDMPGIPYEECSEGEVGTGGEARRGCISPTGYARYGILEGMREKERIGVNPFQVGFIGSTDAHAASPGAVAETAPGVPLGRPDLSPRERLTIADKGAEAWIWSNPGGLVGLWAEENSRESLFESMRRREAFATSGPRIRPRLFAGWDLPQDMCEGHDFAATGYAEGVPMGGELPPAGADAAAGAAGGASTEGGRGDAGRDGRGPVLAASALRDPGTAERPGGLLQRLQIVKVWVGEDGTFYQSVHDVAGNPDNGAGVDEATCEPQGPGADSLCAVWRDEAFDPARPTAYYARVVENPSCRWSTWQCLALPADERPDGCTDPRVPTTIQERAWTSPIWHDPPPDNGGRS